MAGGAVQRRVGPEQREAVLVLVDLLHGDLPALHAVTLLTICAELALMDVGAWQSAHCLPTFVNTGLTWHWVQATP